MSDASPIKRTGCKIECLVDIAEAQFAPKEKDALKELGKEIKSDGFRAGNVPEDVLREKLDPNQVFEHTIRLLLPETFKNLVEEHDLKPIIPPHVELESKMPVKLKVTFIERPEVKIKGTKKIKVDKQEPKVDDKEIGKMVDYILEKHQKTQKVDRAAAEGDQVTMDFFGKDADGKEIKGIRTEGHKVIIGSKVLLPGFEDELKGTKKGDKKEFTLTFPEKYHAGHLQGKSVTFNVTVKMIEKVSRPELTDEFVKKELQAESAEKFREQIRQSMIEQERQILKEGRRRQLLDTIRDAVQVDLPKELIDEELRSMFEELQMQLKQQGIELEQWMKQIGKTPEEVQKDMREQSEQRLVLRLGLGQLVEDRNIEVSDEEMKQAIDEILAQMPEDQRKNVAPMYEKDQPNYEQLKWQRKIEKVIEEMLA